MDQTTVSIEELNGAKEIHVKLKKINIPKNVTERYNSENKPNALLPHVNIAPKKDEAKDNFKHRTKHTIKDVLNATTLDKLKTKYIHDKVMRDKLSRVDEDHFRTYYEDKTYMERLNEKLEKKINPDRINLINYLNDKKEVSSVLIKRLAEFDEEKINRVNKICQIVSHNEERGKLFKDIIKERLKIKQNRDKVDYKSKIENMGNSLYGFNEIMKEYAKTINKKEKYRDIHNDMQKTYWKKYNTDKMQRTANNKVQNNSQVNSSNIGGVPYVQPIEKKYSNVELDHSQII